MSLAGWESAGVVIGAVAGGLALLGACSAALVRAGKVAARIVRFLDTWNGHGEGVYRTPSMPERMDRQDAELARIRAQVLPNGGDSLRDAVDKARARLDAHLVEAEEANRLFLEHLRGHDGTH